MPDMTYHPPRSDEAAWAAGIFEGEGSIYYYKAKNRWTLQVQMTDEDVVRRLQEVLGCGSVTGPHFRKDWKPTWSWKSAAQGDVTHVLALFLPYLGLRRKAKALEALASVTPRLHARTA